MSYDAASRFLAHRQKALYQLSQNQMIGARYHLQEGLFLAVSMLLPSERTNGKEAILALEPIFGTALAIHQCIEDIDQVTGTLFDENLSKLEMALFSYARWREDVRAEMRLNCAACGSLDQLDEDVDNPGTFYCVPCWMAYGDSNEVASSEKSHKSIRYEIEELVSLRMSVSSARDRMSPELLGHEDERSLEAMMRRLPLPWEDRSKDKQRKFVRKEKATPSSKIPSGGDEEGTNNQAPKA